jgi:Uma2 family endonuclease
VVVETSSPPVVAKAGMEVTEEEYKRIALDDPDANWELHEGRLREKPGMTWDHTNVISELCYLFRHQLDLADYRVQAYGGRLRRSPKKVYVPDLIVVPTNYGRTLRGRDDRLAAHREPVPLVVEVWSRSTGGYDVDKKIPVYQARGDLEIWRLHPYQRTLTVWRKQPDGSYTIDEFGTGIVPVQSLPGVSIDLDALFRSL